MPEIPKSARTGLPLIPKGPPRRSCRCDEPAPDALRRGVAEFNRGEYWECHETLEALWRGEPDPVRYLYQGILVAGVGLLHCRRGNLRGAAAKLRAGLTYLEPYAPSCTGIDVTRLRSDLEEILRRVERTGAGFLDPGGDEVPMPRIRMES